MSAYIIAKVNVADWDQYKEYTKVTPGIIEQYGGKFIARGGEVVTLEGPEDKDRIVLIEFPSMEAAKAFYHSDEYKAAKKIREKAATATFVALEGV